MPYNGAGQFIRAESWANDAANKINISSSRMDTEDNGFATGLSQCLLKDGTQTVTANIPFANFKLTMIGNGTAATDAPNLGQVQSQLANWVVATGAADVITATYSPAVTALVDGMELDFRAIAANATTTPSFSPNGITAHPITKIGGSPLLVGDIPAANFEAKLRYNAANTRWELVNPGGYTSTADSSGTWIPGSGAGAPTVNTATYERVGNLVLLNYDFTMPTSASGTNAYVTGIPYPITDSLVTGALQFTDCTSIATVGAGVGINTSTTMGFRTALLNGALATFSQVSGHRVIGNLMYRV